MARIVDLSQPIGPGISLFPTLPPIKITPLPRKGAANMVCEITFADHASTHIDALIHFKPEGETVEKLPLQYCYGDAIVLDFSHKGNGETITAAEVQRAAVDLGLTIRPLDIVLFRTGADCLWGTGQYADYAVSVGVDAVRWLAAQGVKVLGVDAISIDADPTRPAHQLVKEFEYYHIENMANLDKLPRGRFKFAAFPLRLVGASASPIRAVAILEG
ncbi:MAG TPA: cyclase family protein [Dehalococcoidia bacterium]|nr:cyclase family protein [Dehalococcoidia bacterium]